MACHGDEIGERVALLQHLAVFVPRPAELTPTTDVRDGEHHATVEQRQPGDGEPGVLTRLVGTVAVQQHRRRILQTHPVHDRDGHPRAVGGHRPIAALDVILRAVVTQHGLLAQQRPFAGGQIQVVDLHRRDERGCADTHLGRAPVRVGRQPHRHQLRVERDVTGLAVSRFVDRPQLDARQRVGAVADHEVPVERVHRIESHVAAVLDEGAQVGGIADGGVDKREVLRPVVVQDEKAVLPADDGVVERVLDAVAARPHRLEAGVGVGGVGIAHLRGHRAARGDQHVFVAAGAPDRDPEAFVGFVIHLLVRRVRTETVTPHGVRSPGLVDGHVVDGVVVRTPRRTGTHTADLVGIPLARA